MPLMAPEELGIWAHGTIVRWMMVLWMSMRHASQILNRTLKKPLNWPELGDEGEECGSQHR